MAGKKKVAAKAAPKQELMSEADMSSYAGVGMEGADADSFAIPFLAILQSGSPQVKKSDPMHVKGAEEGMFFNTVTGELLTEVSVVPCSFKREFLEWVPRSEGGGFRGRHEVGKEPPYHTDDEGRWVLENGNELKDTRQHYVLYQTGTGQWEPALVSMASTQIKKSRKWMTIMNGRRGITPEGIEFIMPSFSAVYTFNAIAESNDKGSWMGWNLEEGSKELNDKAVFDTAVALHASVTKGKVRVDQDAGADASDEF